LTEKEKVEYGKPLTAKSLVVSMIFLVVAMVLSNFTVLYKSKGIFASFMFPFFYLALFNMLLGKISPKLKLNIHEMVLLLMSWFFVLGPFATGIGSFGAFSEMTLYSPIYILADPASKVYFDKWIPSYMAPKSDLAISAFYNGLKPGQSLPWGEFVVPIAYWTTYTTLVFSFGWFLAFGVWGRRWVEVENLTFPLTVPFLYPVEASFDVDKETKKSKWLSLRDPGYKISWIAFIVGVLLAAFPLYNQYVPVGVPGLGDYGEVGLNLPLASVLPGAHLRMIFMHDQWALWLLLPINSLASIVLLWLVVEVIVLVVGVQAGIIPYTRGMEYGWSPSAEWQYPFPYGVAWMGAWMGFGIITLWTLRGRFKELYNSLRGENKTEFGLSLRLITIFGIVVTLGLIIFFIGTGVPVITALIMVGIAFITYTMVGKLASMFWVHCADFCSHGGFSYWLYPGVVSGYWPSTTEVSAQTPAWFATASMGLPFNYDWSLRCSTMGQGVVAGIYKIAYETKTNMKHLLVGALLVIITGTSVAYVSYTWFISHSGGVLRTGSWGSWVGGYKYGGVEWPGGGVTTGIIGDTRYESVFPWHLLGMAIIFAVYFMRMKFTWFWIDPAAIAYSLPFMGWHWGVALIALVVKLVLTRFIGATRFNNYARHMAAGLVMGYVAPLIVVWLIEFFTAMIPNFQSYYVP